MRGSDTAAATATATWSTTPTTRCTRDGPRRAKQPGSQLRYAFSLPPTHADVTAPRPFDEYLLLYNPGSTVAHVNLSLLLTGGDPPVSVNVDVPAGSRSTVHVNDYTPLREVSAR